MNNLITKITASVLAAALIGCSSTQKFMVNGNPGTHIYEPYGEHIATIADNGTAQVKIKGKKYHSFLLAQEPGSDLKVPFALDYKNASMAGSGLFLSGLGLMAAGGATAAVMGESTALAIGAGTALGGGFVCLIYGAVKWAMAGPSDRYRYLKEQHTNNDILFSRPDYTDNTKSPAEFNYNESPVSLRSSGTNTPDVNANSNEVNQNDISGTPVRNIAGSDTSTRTIASDRSTRTLNDLAKQLEGYYVGPGSLSQKDAIIESYNRAVISIKRIDKDHVDIMVYDNNEVEFFSSPARYSIKKEKDGTFTLTHTGISAATIKINKAGKITYLHPRVNIDGSIYTLSIKGSRK